MKFDRFLKYLFFITLAALGVRLYVAFDLMHVSRAVLHPAPSTDPATYIQLSRELVRGEFSGPFYYQPFYYAGFLAPIVWIFGESLVAPIIVQAILGALTVFLTGLIGKKVLSERAGLIAAILTAISGVLIFYTPYMKIATLQTFNVVFFSYLLILAVQEACFKKSCLFYFLAALVMGISCATRGNIYLMLFGILPLIVLKGRSERKNWQSWVYVGIIFGGIFLAQSPFIIYNSIKLGRLTGASTASAAVLALGNTPESPPGGRDYFMGNGPMEYPESYEIFMARDAERSVPLQILDYFLDKPLEYIELSFRKVLLFWSWGEIPNNVSFYEGMGQNVFLKYNVLGQPFIIIILGMTGIFLSLKKMFKEKDWAMQMLFLCVIFYQLSIAFFYNLGRFRAPILPDMAVWGGIAVAYLIDGIKSKDKRFFKWFGFSLFCGIFLVCFAYSTYRQHYEAIIMTFVRPDGTQINTLNEGEKCIFDYGPMSFGDWKLFTLEKHKKVVKEFKVADLSQEGNLKFMLYGENPTGSALIKINGKTHRFELDKSDNGFYIVPVKLQEGKVTLELLGLGGSSRNKTVSLGLDNQRAYSRSQYDNETVPFEWIMRFYYKE